MVPKVGQYIEQNIKIGDRYGEERTLFNRYDFIDFNNTLKVYLR